jgi:hypothetical protein
MHLAKFTHNAVKLHSLTMLSWASFKTCPYKSSFPTKSIAFHRREVVTHLPNTHTQQIRIKIMTPHPTYSNNAGAGLIIPAGKLTDYYSKVTKVRDISHVMSPNPTDLNDYGSDVTPKDQKPSHMISRSGPNNISPSPVFRAYTDACYSDTRIGDAAASTERSVSRWGVFVETVSRAEPMSKHAPMDLDSRLASSDDDTAKVEAAKILMNMCAKNT